MIAAVVAAAGLVGTTVGGAMALPAPVLGPPSPTPAPVVTPVATSTPTATSTAAPVDTATPTPTAVATLPPQSTKATSVGAVEYAFTLTQTTVDAGDVKVQFDLSRAADPHELVIAGDDGLVYDSGKQDPGSVTKATVTLTPGVYQLVCPLPQHEALGMHARLTVR